LYFWSQAFVKISTSFAVFLFEVLITPRRVTLRVFSVHLSTELKMSDGDDECLSSSSMTTRDRFDKVPDELLLEILSYVPHDEYLNIRLVNRRFSRVSQEGCLWKKVSFSFIYDELTPGRRKNFVLML
jgi:F-box-like